MADPRDDPGAFTRRDDGAALVGFDPMAERAARTARIIEELLAGRTPDD